ncbi:MAG: hypothetical protein Q4D33_10595, partial [Prevotellaceae bacterium]|nr:hypothetical protein [Prevotellaceae bacterium]
SLRHPDECKKGGSSHPDDDAHVAPPLLFCGFGFGLRLLDVALALNHVMLQSTPLDAVHIEGQFSHKHHPSCSRSR